MVHHCTVQLLNLVEVFGSKNQYVPVVRYFDDVRCARGPQVHPCSSFISGIKIEDILTRFQSKSQNRQKWRLLENMHSLTWVCFQGVYWA